MNNKILIGSIIAVTILIGVSFTTVVGYRSLVSDVKVSPLFNIRSSRAIDEESEELRCEYVGKGDKITFSISRIDSKIASIQEFIDVIRRMDDKIYSNLIAQIIPHLKHQKQMTEKEITEVLQALNYVRKKPNIQKIVDMKNSRDNETPKLISYNVLTCDWFPGCWILVIIRDILFVILVFPPWLFLILTNEITIGQRITLCTCNYQCE